MHWRYVQKHTHTNLGIENLTKSSNNFIFSPHRAIFAHITFWLYVHKRATLQCRCEGNKCGTIYNISGCAFSAFSLAHLAVMNRTQFHLRLHDSERDCGKFMWNAEYLVIVFDETIKRKKKRSNIHTYIEVTNGEEMRFVAKRKHVFASLIASFFTYNILHKLHIGSE